MSADSVNVSRSDLTVPSGCSGPPCRRLQADGAQSDKQNLQRMCLDVLTDDTRMRQFSYFWTRPPFLFRCTQSGVSVREFLFLSSLKFACHLRISIAMHQCKG